MAYEKNNKLHIVAVNAAIRRDDGKYLVLKRGENEKAYPGYWCFPGGKVEGNDTVAKTLADEILEETGLVLKPDILYVRDTSFVRPDDQTVKVFVYWCKVENGEVVLEKDSFTGYRWILPAELDKLEHTNLDQDIEVIEAMIKRGVSL